MMLRWLKRMGIVAGALFLLATLVLVLGLRASLPTLSGKTAVAGLQAPVSIERDGVGVVTITGTDRLDVARATGFVHAQDRYFQMDLLRRTAAGELAGLLGSALLPVDSALRPENLRAAAAAALMAEPPATRALLAAYGEGVNAGLNALGSRPFEYWLLRQTPQPWNSEDSMLVLLAMFLDLTDRKAAQELSAAYLSEVLGDARAHLMAPAGGPWDAPIIGSARPIPTIPARWPAVAAPAPGESSGTIDPGPEYGSNNWAVAGAASAHGGAMVADDMHLGLRLPNIWYRMRLVVDGQLDITGVTLPGLPAVVAGSNGSVAWGFTNSYGDWADIIQLDDTQIRAQTVELEIAGAESQTLRFETSDHGPVTRDPLLGPIATRWLAREPGGLNLGLVLMEQARTLEEAVSVANLAGIPPQNAMMADADGRIGWTIAGRIPVRQGYDPTRPARLTDGAGWTGWLPAANYPRVLDPADHRLWTANSRVVDGDMLAAIGDGGYAFGARATQIRDALRAKPTLSEADMLAIQLDDRAVYLASYRGLLIDTLAAMDSNEAAAALDAVTSGARRAAKGDHGYLLVRQFHDALAKALYETLAAPVFADYPDAPLRRSRQFEHTMAALLQNRPSGMLPAELGGWDGVLDRAAQIAIDTADGRSWGQANTVAIRHPIAEFLPDALARRLSAPTALQPGDRDMPRVAGPAFGASQRFVVSPGREDQGYFHMPGGQSGHPLSPWFLAGHDDWLHGRRTPFLPGPAKHTLTLTP